MALLGSTSNLLMCFNSNWNSCWTSLTKCFSLIGYSFLIWIEVEKHPIQHSILDILVESPKVSIVDMHVTPGTEYDQKHHTDSSCYPINWLSAWLILNSNQPIHLCMEKWRDNAHQFQSKKKNSKGETNSLFTFCDSQVNINV